MLRESESGASQSTKKDPQQVSKPSEASGLKIKHTSSTTPLNHVSNNLGRFEKEPENFVNSLDAHRSPLVPTGAKQHPSQLAWPSWTTGQGKATWENHQAEKQWQKPLRPV
jgi:hypothetical protein